MKKYGNRILMCTVTMTTGATHNIPAGTRPLQLLLIDPPAFIPTDSWTPDGSGSGMVSITWTGAATSSTLAQIQIRGSLSVGHGTTRQEKVFAANVLSATVSIASFDTSVELGFRDLDAGYEV